MNNDSYEMITYSCYSNRSKSLSFHHTQDKMGNSPFCRKIPPEYHNFYEIVYFDSECSVTYVIEGTIYQPCKGDILLINCNEYHVIKIDFSEEKGKFYNRFVLQLGKTALPFDSEILNQVNAVFSAKHRLIKAKYVQQFGCFNYLNQMDELCRNQSDTYFYTNLISSILLFIVELHKTYFSSNDEHSQNNIINPLVENAIMYIEKNIENDISPESLAKDLFISKFYLSRIFSSYMHISVKQYILIKKMNYADSLIRNGLSAQQASAKIGYNYYTSFYHSYKKVFGHSPTKAEHSKQSTELH